MLRILWITAAAIVAIGWLAYGVWRVIDRSKEKKGKKPTSKHRQEVKKSFEEYMKKMEKFEKPTYKRE
jgi:type VI protein secretion system component VasK